MAVVNHPISIHRYIGASTDTKPTIASHSGVAEPTIGSTFYEYDTGLLYTTYDGTNWVLKDNVSKTSLKTIRVTKALAAAGNYDIGDVMSEDADAGEGTDWDFTAIGRVNGASGLVIKAVAICETTALAPRLTLFLFKAAPTCELDDNAANTAVLHADLANYIGKIDFPALEDLGTGDSEATIVPGVYPGSLPLAFDCAAGADDLFGVLVTRDAITDEAAGMDMTIVLTAVQY